VDNKNSPNEVVQKSDGCMSGEIKTCNSNSDPASNSRKAAAAGIPATSWISGTAKG